MNHRVLLKIKKTLSTYLVISSINIFKVFTFFHFLRPLTWRETNENRASLNLLENVIFIRWTFIIRKILKKTLTIQKISRRLMHTLTSDRQAWDYLPWPPTRCTPADDIREQSRITWLFSHLTMTGCIKTRFNS